VDWSPPTAFRFTNPVSGHGLRNAIGAARQMRRRRYPDTARGKPEVDQVAGAVSGHHDREFAVCLNFNASAAFTTL
jgi:hypothetical protein